MYKLKHFFKRLFRVLKAIPVIWNCEEWDYSFTLELLKWRLEECAKYFKSSTFAEGDSKRAEEMEEVIAAIDEYFNPSYKQEPLRVAYVFVPAEKDGSRLILINKKTGEPLTEEEEEQYDNYLIEAQRYESEDCWNKIWDLIKECGQGWWN